AAPVRLNPDLPADLERIISKALEKDRNLRYQHAADMRADLQRLKRDTDTGRMAAVSSGAVAIAQDPVSRPVSAPTQVPSFSSGKAVAASSAMTAVSSGAVLPAQETGAVGTKKPWGKIAAIAGMVVVLIGGGLLYLRFHQAGALTTKDTILIADFVNTTCDNVFDGTLRKALAVDLGQSPYLNVLSEGKVQQTLALMGKPSDTRLTPEIGREICQRSGVKALLTGSISSLGNQYMVT